jgi:hypothetical protein
MLEVRSQSLTGRARGESLMSNLFGNIVKIEGDPEVVAREWPKLRQSVWETLCASPDRDVQTPVEPHDFEDLPLTGNAVKFWTSNCPLKFHLPRIEGAKVSHEWRDESSDVDYDRCPDDKGRVAQLWHGVYIDLLFVGVKHDFEAEHEAFGTEEAAKAEEGQ